MPYDRRQIRKLTTASEFELVDASSADSIRRLSAQALQKNIARARRLRDKQRDLLRRQRLASRSRTGTKATGNARTAQKAEVFDETLNRFTRRLQAMTAKPRPGAGAKKSAARKSRAAPKGTGPKPPARGGARKTGAQATLRQKATTPRVKAIQAHIGSRGRRAQARRDSR